jgi:FkbM family methyltransferase
VKNFLFLRNILAAVLSWVPLQAFDPIRNAYFNSRKTKGLNYFISKVLISVARYRPIHQDAETFELKDMAGVFIYNVDSKIVRLLYWYGCEGYEGKETLLWQVFCRNSKSVLELGGNIGYYSILGGGVNNSLKYRVLEPHPVSFRILNKNKEINGLENLEVIQKAVVGTRTDGKAELYVQKDDPDIAPSGAYLNVNGSEVNRTKKDRFWVDTIEAKELIAGVDLIKIDIEGLEREVLGSIMDYLIINRPPIFLEVRNKAVLLKEFIADELLEKADYELYAIGHGELLKVDKESVKTTNFLKEYGNRDVFFIKKGFWNKERIQIENDMLNTNGQKNASSPILDNLSFKKAVIN